MSDSEPIVVSHSAAQSESSSVINVEDVNLANFNDDPAVIVGMGMQTFLSPFPL